MLCISTVFEMVQGKGGEGGSWLITYTKYCLECAINCGDDEKLRFIISSYSYLKVSVLEKT